MKRPMRRLTSPTVGCRPSLFDLQTPFCACVVGKVSLTSRMMNMWSFICSLGRAQLLLLSSCYYLPLGVSLHKGQTPAPRPGAHLCPVLLPLSRPGLKSLCLYEVPLDLNLLFFTHSLHLTLHCCVLIFL